MKANNITVSDEKLKQIIHEGIMSTIGSLAGRYCQWYDKATRNQNQKFNQMMAPAIKGFVNADTSNSTQLRSYFDVLGIDLNQEEN